jgi:cytidylate kinase
MIRENATVHLAETLEQLGHHWESRRRATAALLDLKMSAPKAFTIALEREAGTNGTAVAREVGKKLGWPVYDHELLERIAQQMGLRTALLESVDERRQSWLTEAFEAFLSAPFRSDSEPFVSADEYVQNLVKTVLALAAHGECVIVGRGAGYILPAKSTLRVRLVAPKGDRVAAVSRGFGIPAPEALHRTRTMDRDRIDFVKDHFLKDPTDPEQYDLLVNTSRFSVAASAELIMEALHHLQV